MRSLRAILLLLVWLALGSANAEPPSPCEQMASTADLISEISRALGEEGIQRQTREILQMHDLAASVRELAEGLAASPEAPVAWKSQARGLGSATRQVDRELRGRDLIALVAAWDTVVAALDGMVDSCEALVREDAAAGSQPNEPRDEGEPQPGEGWSERPLSVPPPPPPALPPPHAPPSRAEPGNARGPSIRLPFAIPSPGEKGRVVGITVEHNIARSAVDAPPLEWSPRLAAIAQAWSDRIAAQGCRLERSPDRSLGENLAGFSGTRASVGDVVASWIEERACYAGPDAKSAHTCRPGCGGCAHYTQVVWRGSTHLGCGVASCGADREVWTCNYEPAGNVVGAAPY